MLVLLEILAIVVDRPVYHSNAIMMLPFQECTMHKTSRRQSLDVMSTYHRYVGLVNFGQIYC